MSERYVPKNLAQIVESVAANGSDQKRAKVQGLVTRARWDMEPYDQTPTLATARKPIVTGYVIMNGRLWLNGKPI